MEKKAAKTTWGPMIQVALEQLVPKEQRVVYDVVAYQLLPAIFRGFVRLCRLDLVRRTLLNLADRRAGYSVTEPTFFIWEGVTQYISETAVRKVFEFFEKVPVGSRLVFTYVRKDFIEGRQLYGLKFLYNRAVVKGRLWQFGLEPESIGAFLNQYSWKEVEHVGNAEYQERYLKPVNRQLLVMEVERAVHAEMIMSVKP